MKINLIFNGMVIVVSASECSVDEILDIKALKCQLLLMYFYKHFCVQTNPFDLFETFFGPSMGGFPGLDSTGFKTGRRSTSIKGEDLR